MKLTNALICGSFFLFVGAVQSRASNSYCDSIVTNIVSNCGFETGDFTGWTLTGNDTPGELNNLYGVEGQDPVDAIFPNSGNYQAYFADQVDNATTLSQTLSTIAGYTYTVELFLAQDTAATGTCNAVACANEFDVTLGGVTVFAFNYVPVQGYTEYIDTVRVTSASSALDITLGNDLGESLLDDVTVFTPEPSAWALMGAGLLGLGFAARRKAA
jgi:hypothetical protein